jgi:hypothetical protein
MVLRLLLLAVAFALTGCGEPMRFTGGKDTVELFGDGTWSIVKTWGGPNAPRMLNLANSETHSFLVLNIADWRQEGDWVFAVGEDGEYAAVNFRTNEHGKYRAVEEAPEEHRPALRRLRRR